MTDLRSVNYLVIVLQETPVIFFTGRAWASDYGDPQDPHDFDFIAPYSPLHNISSDRMYPAILAMTADRMYQLSGSKEAF